jgi:TonB family protein
MQQGFHRRAGKRRGAPALPKKRKAPRQDRTLFQRSSAGFEALIPEDGSQDYFFSGWFRDPDEAAEYLEHGEGRDAIASNPRMGVTASAAFHLLLVLFLLLEPSLGLLGPRTETPEQKEAREKKNPLVLFIPKPIPPPAVTAVPLVPVVPRKTPPPAPEKPPRVADNRMVIPKAMIPAPDEKQKFMNDLPFSRGNTDEFYTDKEVKEPGKKGEAEKPRDEPPQLAPEPGKDETRAEKAEGSETGNEGTEAAKKALDPKEVAELLFGNPRARAEARPRTQIRPPEPRPAPGDVGAGGEEGAFSDIRRFLAGAQFHNPEGGLVSNTNNTLYYNDKGANFVPWLNRMLAEVRRNWYVPYSISFDHGHVAIGVSVARDGTITDLKLLIPSGVSGFDNAAVGALRASQLLPLPADYPDERFEIILVFWYNERPYDLFG